MKNTAWMIVLIMAATVEDSPLVQAAKRTAAARAKATNVITNVTVANSTGVISEARTSAAIPALPPATSAAATAAAPATPARRAAEPAPGAFDPRLPQASQNTTASLRGVTPVLLFAPSTAPSSSSAPAPSANAGARPTGY